MRSVALAVADGTPLFELALACEVFGVDRGLARTWYDFTICGPEDAEVGGWLKGHGVTFFPVVNWAERGVYGDGNSVPRFHITWGTGKALVDQVWGAIQRHPRRSHSWSNSSSRTKTGRSFRCGSSGCRAPTRRR